MEGLEADIASLNKEELNWNKNDKFGKKSNANFQEWLKALTTMMHVNQSNSEDALFENSF